ncbi:hypothetical protein SAMN06264849_11086 [Melghirimyces algeriensis]|uniref:DUF2269 domain-containing protein n=2 Tax=Melghirimyces algeriensis TaxID=910412 RepID=A0A521ERQ8_9BACL|nr:hypothetical protein SAMN06264849_11086 [Melghirimyces algeriensis]
MLVQITIYFHVLGAVAMGFYLLLPFFLQKALLQNRSVLHVFYWMNFISQWVLVIQLLTGGYLYMLGDYSLMWIISVSVVYTAIGAFGGLFGYHIRKFLQSSSPSALDPWMRKVRFHAILTTVSMLVMMILMLFPYAI